jgi:MarR family transcriptional regulator for hemolysin
MPAKFDPDAIGFLITDVARLLRAEFDRRIAGAGLGLTPGDARTLVNAARAGGVRQTVLAERMGVEAMTLSAYLDRLEAHGLVRRVPDPSDRRAKLVDVTDAAHPVLEEISRLSTELRGDISASLAPTQLEEIRHGLKTIRAALAEMRPECGKGSSGS